MDHDHLGPWIILGLFIAVLFIWVMIFTVWEDQRLDGLEDSRGRIEFLLECPEEDRFVNKDGDTFCHDEVLP